MKVGSQLEKPISTRKKDIFRVTSHGPINVVAEKLEWVSLLVRFWGTVVDALLCVQGASWLGGIKGLITKYHSFQSKGCALPDAGPPQLGTKVTMM